MAIRPAAARCLCSSVPKTTDSSTAPLKSTPPRGPIQWVSFVGLLGSFHTVFSLFPNMPVLSPHMYESGATVVGLLRDYQRRPVSLPLSTEGQTPLARMGNKELFGSVY